MMIDTGAHYSCMDADFAKRNNIHIDTSSQIETPQLLTANSEPLSVVGLASTDVSIGGYACIVQFVVIADLYHKVIFGLDALRENNAVIDIATSTFSIGDHLAVVPLINRFSPRNILRTVQSVTLPSLHEICIPVRIAPSYTLGPSLIEPLYNKYSKKCTVAKTYVEPHTHRTVCQIINMSDKACIIPARTAIASIMHADIVASVDDNKTDTETDRYDTDTENALSHEQRLNVLINKGFKLTQGDLTKVQFHELVELLYTYRDAFASEIHELPGVKGVEYEIKLKAGTQPTRKRQYRYSPELRQVIREELHKWEEAGIAEEGDAIWSHPIVLVKKRGPDGKITDPPRYRVCLDLRDLNKTVILESYPIPTFDNIVDCLGDPPPQYYSLMDAVSGYLQVPCTKESSKLLGVETDQNTYVLKRLPFGLATSPMVYQKLMNKLISGYQYIFACAYLDDLLIYSRDWHNHKKHLRLVLERTRDIGLRMKPDKCVFAKHEIKYLGMLLGANGIRPDPAKIEVIKNAKAPTNAKLLKSFIGLCSFYRRFVRGFAQICAPFRNLLKKNATFDWTDKHNEAFERLKRAMTSAPVYLAIPNWNDKMVIISDSSKLACGFIIANETKNGVQHPILYGGRMWNKHEQNYSISELEMAGILYCLETHSQYFVGRKFTIYTDHISNTFVQKLKNTQGRLYRWALRLQNFQFDIKHMKGSVMPADFISRVIDHTDSNAADLEDDSQLVFPITDIEELQSSQTVGTLGPKPIRSYDSNNNKPYRTVISLPWVKHEQDLTAQCCDSSAAYSRMQTTTEPRTSSGERPDGDAMPSTPSPMTPLIEQNTDSQARTAGTAEAVQYTDDLVGSVHPLDGKVLNPVTESSTEQLTPTVEAKPARWRFELVNDTDLYTLQRDSPDLATTIAYLQDGKLPNDEKTAETLKTDAVNWYIDKDGILYHIHDSRRRNPNSVKPIILQVAIPETLRQKTLQGFHDRLGHFRLEKTYETILQHYYWRGLYADLRNYLQNCEDCQKASQRPPKRVILQHAPLGRTFDTLVIDHIRLPPSTDPTTQVVYEYALTMVDQLSNWVEIVPVKDTTAKTTALVIQREWISRYGFPRNLHSDLGAAFTSTVFEKLCKLYAIDHTLASSQNHKSVSRAEHAHKMILSGLRKICEKPSDWISKLPGLLLSLHNTVLTTTGITPAYSIFHRELRIPLLLELPVLLSNPDNSLTELAQNTQLVDTFIQEKTQESFAKASKYHDRSATIPRYNINDRVLLYDEHVPVGIMRKLHKFYRPVIIKECLPHFCYKVQDCTSNRMLPFKIHASRIKPLTHGKGLTGLTQATGPMNEQLETPAQVSDKAVPTTPRRRARQERPQRLQGPAKQISQQKGENQSGQLHQNSSQRGIALRP